MRPIVYPSYCLVQYVKRMYTTKYENFSIKTAYQTKRKAIAISKMMTADLLINKKLGNRESIEGNQWGKVRKELLQRYEDVSEVNIDSQIYDICYYFDRLDQGISYYQFLERNKYPLNLSTMTTYLRLMALYKTKCQAQLTKEEEKSILKVYNNITKKYELLDPRSASYCIDGLSLTKKWKECFKLLEMIKLIQSPGITEMSTIIAAAIRNDQVDLAWKMMDEFLVNNPVKQKVYEEYLNYCKRNFSRGQLVNMLEKMFCTWQKYNIRPQKSTIDQYQELLESIGHTTKYTSITMNGICQHCKIQLKQTELTKEDFRVLSSAILNNLIVGKDVYRNTSPQELKNYLIFLQNMKPYDVVIDGLNVAYANGFNNEGKRDDSRGLLGNIIQVVDYFRKRNKRTLVVGRVHMKWWSTRETKKLEDITDVFYIKNISQDDPFLLHVTLSSGSNTCFVSRDFMRQHIHKIDDPVVKQLFKNWQMSHQYFFYTLGDRNNTIKLVKPLPYDPSTQNNDEGWHIPYTTHTQLAVPVLFEAPREWFCLKYKKQENC